MAHVWLATPWRIRENRRKLARDGDKMLLAQQQELIKQLREELRAWESWYSFISVDEAEYRGWRHTEASVVPERHGWRHPKASVVPERHGWRHPEAAAAAPAPTANARPIDYSRWDHLCTSDEEEGDDEDDGCWGMDGEEDDDDKYGDDEFLDEADDGIGEEEAAAEEEREASAELESAKAAAEEENEEAGRSRMEANEDDQVTDDPAHNKRALLRRFQQSAYRVQRSFTDTQRRLVGMGVPIERIHRAIGPTKQQQQQQHAMYIKMIEEMAETQFDMDGSAKVLSMLDQSTTDLEHRISCFIEEAGAG